ncbi:hypothetical protein GW17_00025626 [Ensete ventricosum]|nr:hypothetical protein GW17_00025626 [Ensete ventricosum]
MGMRREITGRRPEDLPQDCRRLLEYAGIGSGCLTDTTRDEDIRPPSSLLLDLLGLALVQLSVFDTKCMARESTEARPKCIPRSSILSAWLEGSQRLNLDASLGLLNFTLRCLARKRVLLILTHRKSNPGAFFTECITRGSVEARPRGMRKHWGRVIKVMVHGCFCLVLRCYSHGRSNLGHGGATGSHKDHA